MKKVFLILALLLPSLAQAQTSRNPCYTTGALTTQGIPNCIGVGTTTPLPVTTATIPGTPLDIEGNVAAGATDIGNPVKIGGLVNTTTPTALVTGQRQDLWVGGRGNVSTFLTGQSGTNNAVVQPPGDAQNMTGSGLQTNSVNMLMTSAVNADRAFTCPNSAVVNVTATTTELVPLTASQIIRVCSITLTAAVASTATIVYGTGTNCGTGTTSLTGAMALGASIPLAISSGNGSLLRTATANALCLTAGTNAVTGFVTYAKY